MEDEGERENQNGGKRSYSLMALSAPMFFSKVERACQRLELRPGKFYTIGRSRSSCDVIFHDNRVSRQHCQVFLEPGSQKLYLLDGAPSRLRTRAETKRLQESRSDDKVLKACERESSALDAAHDDGAIQNPQMASHHLLKSSSSKRVKSSLNGIFLNGQRVEDGACKVLAPGDEVSLVACTKCAQAVDPDFGAAVGFLVKVVPEYERLAVQNSLHLPPNNRKTENSSQLITKSSEEGDKPAIIPAFGPQTTCEPILGILQSTSILLSEAGNPSPRPLAGGVFEECIPGLLSEKGDLLLGNLGVEALTANSLVNIRGQAPEDLPGLLDISTQKRCGESTGNGLASEDKSRGISMETHTLALETLLYKDAELTVSSISVSKRRAIEARSGILAKSLFTSDSDITLQDEKRCTNPINGMPSETFTGIPPAKQEPEICDFTTVMAFGASSGISFPAVSITSTRRCGEASESCPNPLLLQTGSSITDVKTGLILEYNEGGLVSTSGTLQKNTTMDAEDSNNEWTEHHCPDLYEDVCNPSLTLKGVRDRMWPDPKEKAKVCGRSSTEIMKLMRRNRDVQPADGPCTLSCKPGVKYSIPSEEVAAEEKEKASAGTIAVVPHTSIQEEQIIAHKCSIDDSKYSIHGEGLVVKEMEKSSEGTTALFPHTNVEEEQMIMHKCAKFMVGYNKDSIHGEGGATEEMEKATEGTIAFVPYTSIQEEQMIIHKCAKFLVNTKVPISISDPVLKVHEAHDLPSVEHQVEDTTNGSCNFVREPTILQPKSAAMRNRHVTVDSELMLNLAAGNCQSGLCPDVGKGPGFRGFCLNRLEDSEGTDEGVSLQELLAPLKDLVAIFAATFSGDILWFLTSNNLPADLPVTVACHDYERCWSTSEKDRTASPYPQWPNLTIVYPPFPDICAFSSKSKEGLRRGIGCHHPKLFLLRFQDKLRVVISSANLNQRQWLRTTNTVWWRDFPQLKIRNYHALFHSSGVSKGDSVPSSTAGDFGAQLAYFVSCLLVDVPAMAHWVVGLAQYDFSGAEASLVVSIPGVHGSLCSSVHQNSMENLELGTSSHSLPRKLLGIVSSTVVGITFRFCAAADPNGSRVRALAKLLNSIDPDEDGMIVVLLRRAKNVPADCNAVSVVVSSGAMAMGAEAFLQEDVRRDSNSPSSSQDQCIQLGFLPRNMAKSVAPLCDGGLFAFIARIWPKEALSVASGFSDSYVRLNLYIYEGADEVSGEVMVVKSLSYILLLMVSEQGPRFHELSTVPPTSEQAIAVSGLLSMVQYALGLHRLEQVLSRYKWPNSAETDFIFGSSSIGTSLDAPFLAAFSAAAGHRAIASSASDDSDSQWGCWTAEHEAENPSIGVVFPTIDRAKAAKDGVLSHYGLLCFAEKTWERLKPAKLLHDAVPSSASRDGIPMHSKVAIRRFQHHPSEASFGWVYCGSHNFSPAAWGRPLARAPANTIPVVGTALHISNYELGLIFVEPPPHSDFSSDTNDSNSQVQVSKPVKGSEVIGLDRFQLPFVMPPPRYQASDQPATGRAMYGILLELQNQCNTLEEVVDLEERLVESEVESGESEHIEDAEMVGKVEDVTVGQIKASQSEQQYAEALWSQMT